MEKGRKPLRVWRLLGIIAGCGLLGVVLLGVLAHYTLLHAGLIEMSFDSSACHLAAAAVMNGTLKPAPDGVVKLPPQWASASIEGEAYVTVESSGKTWVLFRTWRGGKGMNLSGYVYCSVPLTGATPADISILAPEIDWLGTSRSRTGLETEPVDAQLDANWYHVHFDLN